MNWIEHKEMVVVYFEEIYVFEFNSKVWVKPEETQLEHPVCTLIHDIIIHKTKIWISNPTISSKEVPYLTTISVVNEWKMSMEQRWKDTDRRNPKCS